MPRPSSISTTTIATTVAVLMSSPQNHCDTSHAGRARSLFAGLTAVVRAVSAAGPLPYLRPGVSESPIVVARPRTTTCEEGAETHEQRRQDQEQNRGPRRPGQG